MLGGGLIGSGARTGLSHFLPVVPGAFPASTLTVNLVGSLLIGLYLARREMATTVQWSLQFWAIGVIGSFTTFSAFGIEAVNLVRTQRWLIALLYVAVSIIGGLALASIGQRLGRAFR